MSARVFQCSACFHLLTSFKEMPIFFSSRTQPLPTEPSILLQGVLTLPLLCASGQPTQETGFQIFMSYKPYSSKLKQKKKKSLKCHSKCNMVSPLEIQKKNQKTFSLYFNFLEFTSNWIMAIYQCSSCLSKHISDHIWTTASHRLLIQNFLC